MIDLNSPPTIVVMGLGYVGLPLSLAMARKYKVLGFDTNPTVVQTITQGQHPALSSQETKEVTALIETGQLSVTSDCNVVAGNVFIVTVPTPIYASYQPDLRCLQNASTMVAQWLCPGNIVIYESTVYPGCTEEFCIPLLESISGLTLNTHFGVGYSPERVNPGDRDRPIDKIVKLTSGSSKEVAKYVNDLYASVITAGTYLAPSIKVAEAAKAVENAQRDLNISFVNELALIFDKLNIDTQEVLDAAATKWNFLPFKPGLVGGHCIGVDPYYLAFKAKSVGYEPKVILSGRAVNEQMASHIAQKVMRLMRLRGLVLKGARVLILGITFKENASDMRNTQVLKLVQCLQEHGMHCATLDPWANEIEAAQLFGKAPLTSEFNTPPNTPNTLLPFQTFDAVILAVAHREFLSVDWRNWRNKQGILFDAKGVLPKHWVDGRL